MKTYAALALVFVGLTAAGLISAGAAAAPIQLVDDVGRKLILPARPERIVSTAPANTEALFALGAGERVVGVTTFCIDPPEAKTRAKVGNFSSLDFERILALKPDLVVATWLEQRRGVARMEALGLPVLVVYPKGLDGVLGSLLLIGRAVGEEAAAEKLVGGLQARLAAVDARVAKIAPAQRPTVLVAVDLSPLYSAGPGSPVDQAVTRAGGRNVLADLGKSYAPVGREAVIARDPEWVLLAKGAGGAEAFARIPGFDGLQAVRRGQVREVDPALLFHDNQRLVEGVELVLELLHPLPAAGSVGR